MNRRRKIVAIMLVLLMLCTNTRVFAVEMNDQNTGEEMYNNEFGFSYTEFIDPDNRTIRTYQRENENTGFNLFSLLSRTASEVEDTGDDEKTKAVLSALGMEDTFIEELRDYSFSLDSAIQYTP